MKVAQDSDESGRSVIVTMHHDGVFGVWVVQGDGVIGTGVELDDALARWWKATGFAGPAPVTPPPGVLMLELVIHDGRRY